MSYDEIETLINLKFPTNNILIIGTRDEALKFIDNRFYSNSYVEALFRIYPEVEYIILFDGKLLGTISPILMKQNGELIER